MLARLHRFCHARTKGRPPLTAWLAKPARQVSRLEGAIKLGGLIPEDIKEARPAGVQAGRAQIS
jgi:hypothetical protein